MTNNNKKIDQIWYFLFMVYYVTIKCFYQDYVIAYYKTAYL